MVLLVEVVVSVVVIINEWIGALEADDDDAVVAAGRCYRDGKMAMAMAMATTPTPFVPTPNY